MLASMRRRIPSALSYGATVLALSLTMGASSLPLLWCSNHSRFEVVYGGNSASRMHSSERDARVNYTAPPHDYSNYDHHENIPLTLPLQAPTIVRADASFCFSVAEPIASLPWVLNAEGLGVPVFPDPALHAVGLPDTLRTIRILI